MDDRDSSAGWRSSLVWRLPAADRVTGPGVGTMIRRCDNDQLEAILEVINDAARAYQGIISPDSWKDPYMPEGELRHEIEAGVVFWGYYEDGRLVGVMGIQDVQDVTLIRHAYVRTESRRKGIGGLNWRAIHAAGKKGTPTQPHKVPLTNAQNEERRELMMQSSPVCVQTKALLPPGHGARPTTVSMSR